MSAVCGVAAVAFIGCAEQRADIPANAQEMSSGNNHLSFTATQPGTVIIEDVNDTAIVYRSRVRPGDTVILDPATNQVTMNGMVVLDKRLHGGDAHRIYFVPMNSTDQPQQSVGY